MRHTVTIRDALVAREVEFGTFTAQVTFTWHPALRGTWHDEPPHAAFGELVDVRQTEGPTLPGAALVEWADDWITAQSDLEEALDRDGGWACAARQKVEDQKAKLARDKMAAAMREAA